MRVDTSQLPHLERWLIIIGVTLVWHELASVSEWISLSVVILAWLAGALTVVKFWAPAFRSDPDLVQP